MELIRCNFGGIGVRSLAKKKVYLFVQILSEFVLDEIANEDSVAILID
jgi:hypothetical protein